MHLQKVFDRLQEAQLYLHRKKCELYVKELDCLGHIIDDNGIHVTTDKMQKVREWRTPQNLKEV